MTLRTSIHAKIRQIGTRKTSKYALTSSHDMDSSPFVSGGAAETQLSSLSVLDQWHMAIFRNALENLLLTGVSESTYAEIIDGLPTLDSWNEFHYWVPRTGNPIAELDHKELCAGSRVKAQKLRSQLDAYSLLFPSQVCPKTGFKCLGEVRLHGKTYPADLLLQ